MQVKSDLHLGPNANTVSHLPFRHFLRRRDTKESTCLLWDITTEKSGLCCHAVRITQNTYGVKCLQTTLQWRYLVILGSQIITMIGITVFSHRLIILYALKFFENILRMAFSLKLLQ